MHEFTTDRVNDAESEVSVRIDCPVAATDASKEYSAVYDKVVVPASDASTMKISTPGVFVTDSSTPPDA